MRRGSGGITRTSGSMPKWRAHSTLNRATDVRELASRATVRTRSIGTWLKTATDATGPSDPMATPGTATYDIAPEVLDGRHQADIHLAGMQEFGAARRDVEADVESIGVAVEAVDERARVEILDRAEAEPAHQPSRP